MKPIYEILKGVIPNDHHRQSGARDLFNARKAAGFAPKTIVDLGCGAGDSVNFFRRAARGARWVGVDIEESPEVARRTRTDAEFLVYDGCNIPLEDGSVDLVFSHQVFEHVRHPEVLLSDVRRVLAPDGLFIGQTSHLEPYHSYSIFNFTPYGWKTICEDAGLEVQEMRPGIDGVTLIQRTHLKKPPSFSQWFANESPLNQEIDRAEAKRGGNSRMKNFRKLLVSGQFCFVCTPAG